MIQVLATGILAGGLYGLVTVGLTLIYGVLKLVNFAHGEFLMIGMYFTWVTCTLLGIDPYASFLLVLPIMFCLGLFVQRFVMQPVLLSAHVIQILTTLGLSLVLQNAALMVFKADFRNVYTSYKTDTIEIGGVLLSVPHVVAFAVAMVSTYLLWLFLQKTNIGMCMRAVSQNDKATKLMGINVNRIYLLAYGIGILLVGIAAILLTPIYSITPTIGANFVMIAFVCVVLGGLGSLPGAMLGGITVGVIEALSGYFIGTEFQQAGYFLVFILILIVRPRGFFGKKGEMI